MGRLFVGRGTSRTSSSQLIWAGPARGKGSPKTHSKFGAGGGGPYRETQKLQYQP